MRAKHRPTGQLVHLGPVWPWGFAERNVQVWLPADYRRDEPRPALVVFDGQNAFDDHGSTPGWHLHRAVDGLDRRRSVAPIVVAVPHGPQRADELTPFVTDGWGGQGGRFMEWLVAELMPQLRREFALPAGAVGAALAGSSWGGLFALYGHYRFPGEFGGAIALSPAMWVGRGQAFAWLERQPTPAISRVYVDCGALEDHGLMLENAKVVVDQLRGRGYGRRQLWWRPDPRGEHTELAWRRRLPRALRFFFRKS